MKLILSLFIALTLFILVMAFQPVSTPAQGNCDASYPDFCIAPAPPDLDCVDVGRKNFTVLSPDPHHFDGDKDGIGCEA
jgi:micrococcal nuclease